MKYFFKYSLTIIFYLSIISCSVKKDKFTNRLYHKSTSWFNTVFNGEEALAKELKNVEDNYQENYNLILPVAPGQVIQQIQDEDYEYEFSSIYSKKKNIAGAIPGFLGRQEEKETSNESSYKYAEKKAIKAIENHSMMIKGTERNKSMSKAYLLLGKARYYQGKSYEALDAFNYIIQNIKENKHDLETKFWRAKTNFQAGNKQYALEELVKLYDNKDINKDLKEEVAALYSQILIDDNKYQTAIESLDKAKQNTKSKKRKGRYTFIQAQLNNKLGNNLESSKLFDQVKKYHPGFEIEFQSKMSISQNFIPGQNNYDAFQGELKKMLTDSKYKEYKDQIYYNQGLLAERSEKFIESEKFYKKGLLEDSSSSRIKSLTYAHTGNVLFTKEDYMAAGNYYDSAISISQNDEIKNFLGNRKDHLLKLINNNKIVTKNDSILNLSKMTLEDQKSYIETYINELKRIDNKEKELLQKKLTEFESATKTTAFNNPYENSKKFYFYNDNVIAKGEIEFKKRWGDRLLNDNWRTSTALNKINETYIKEDEIDLIDEKRYDVDSYISTIPKDPIILNNLKEERDSAQFNMGLIYLDEIKNKSKSVTTLESLIENKPNEDLKAQAYFNLFKALEDTPSEAEKYKNILLENYPNTSYAVYAKNPKSQDFIIGNSKQSINLYEQAYKAYEEGDINKCKQLYKEAMSKYGKEEIIAKFALLDAYTEGKSKGEEAMITSLENVSLTYPNLPEGIKAKELLLLLNKNEKSSTDKSKKTQNEEINNPSNTEGLPGFLRKRNN